MGLMQQCPTCGATVRVVFGDEGTAHYEPVTAIDALAKEVAPMAAQLRRAVNRVAELEKALDLAASELRSEGHYEASGRAYAPLEDER